MARCAAASATRWTLHQPRPLRHSSCVFGDESARRDLRKWRASRRLPARAPRAEPNLHVGVIGGGHRRDRTPTAVESPRQATQDQITAGTAIARGAIRVLTPTRAGGGVAPAAGAHRPAFCRVPRRFGILRGGYPPMAADGRQRAFARWLNFINRASPSGNAGLEYEKGKERQTTIEISSKATPTRSPAWARPAATPMRRGRDRPIDSLAPPGPKRPAFLMTRLGRGVALGRFRLGMHLFPGEGRGSRLLSSKSGPAFAGEQE